MQLALPIFRWHHLIVINTSESGIAEALLTEQDVAKTLNVSVGTLRRWRLLREGPKFRKLGSLVRYDPHDVKDWVQAQPSGGSGRFV